MAVLKSLGTPDGHAQLAQLAVGAEAAAPLALSESKFGSGRPECDVVNLPPPTEKIPGRSKIAATPTEAVAHSSASHNQATLAVKTSR